MIRNKIFRLLSTSISIAERDKAGVVENLLRLSVGVEDVEDLINDLKQVLG